MTHEDFKNPLSLIEQQQLLGKISEDPLFILQVDTSLGKVQLQIKSQEGEQLIVLPRGSSPTLDLSGVKKVQWVYDRSRFEAEAKIQTIDDILYSLIFTKQIYKLQRRKNFRTFLPNQWKRQIAIHQHDGKLINIVGQIEDLSLTGCFFTTQNSVLLTEQEEVAGELYIENFKSIRFKAKVIRERPQNAVSGYGLEFFEVEGFGNETLHQITLKAARFNRDYT